MCFCAGVYNIILFGRIGLRTICNRCSGMYSVRRDADVYPLRTRDNNIQWVHFSRHARAVYTP